MEHMCISTSCGGITCRGSAGMYAETELGICSILSTITFKTKWKEGSS